METFQGETEIRPELLGSINGLNSFVANNSGARSNMDAAHISQMLVLPFGTPKRITSGMEFEYAKYTFKTEAQSNLRVLGRIEKFASGMGQFNFKRNSETLLLVEDIKKRQLDALEIRPFHCNHKFGGFRYEYTEALRALRAGDWIPEGTTLAHSPAVREDGSYAFGIEANVVMGSFPWVIDDGIAVSDEFCRKAQSVGFGERTAEWGVEYIPLNLYGDENNYKPFPDIGERVRSDGLVFALRKVNPYLSVVDMSPLSLMEPDYTFDELIFGYPDAIVEDIDVWHSHSPDMHKTPSGMDTQARKYWMAIRNYETKLEKFYQDKKREMGGHLNISAHLHNLIVRAGYNNEELFPKQAPRTFKKKKLNDWRVTVHYSYPIIPTLSHKMTDISAGKGVITRVIKKEHMPRDKHGVYADVVLDSESTIHRMNPGRIFEQYINATSDQVMRNMDVAFEKTDWFGRMAYLQEYIREVTPPMADIVEKTIDEFLSTKPSNQEKIDWYREQYEKLTAQNIRLWIPTYTPELGTQLIKRLHEKYPLDKGPITFMGIDGTEKTSHDDIIIGSMYFIMLEKIGDAWGGTAVPKRQHHGIISKLSDSDKYAHNYRDQPIRIFGETETRILAAMNSQGIVSSMLNWANSPAMCDESVKTILSAPKPTNIKQVADYERHAKIESRALQYVKHILECAGLTFEYVDETRFTDAIRINGKFYLPQEDGTMKEVTL